MRSFIYILPFFILSTRLIGQIQGPATPERKQFHEINPSSSTLDNTHQRSDNSTPSSSIVIPKQPAQKTEIPFAVSYKARAVNAAQNNQTIQMLSHYREANSGNAHASKKELWELKLRHFVFANPTTELYKRLQPLYDAAFDSINQMLTGQRPLDLKKAVFLVENAFYGNRLSYTDFCKMIDSKVYVLKQIIAREKLDEKNNIALNYAIQQLYMKPVVYKDKQGITKTHLPFKYDFNDYMGQQDFSKQFVSKLLYTGKGQCHSMPLLYLILADEIGAKANMVYSPEHSFIAFPDEENNYFNFECTSACFTSYGYVMSSGYVSKEAVKSGIYMAPVSLKEVIANQLNDLANEHSIQSGGNADFQLKCAKKSLEFFPNNIVPLMIMANYQSAKAEASACQAGWPEPKDVPKDPQLKKEFDDRNRLYDYMDNLGYIEMPYEDYQKWLEMLKREKEKQESEAIKKALLIKGNIKE